MQSGDKLPDSYLKFLIERLELVFRLVFKTSSRRIKPAVAGSIPALSAGLVNRYSLSSEALAKEKLMVNRNDSNLGIASALLKSGFAVSFFFMYLFVRSTGLFAIAVLRRLCFCRFGSVFLCQPCQNQQKTSAATSPGCRFNPCRASVTASKVKIAILYIVHRHDGVEVHSTVNLCTSVNLC